MSTYNDIGIDANLDWDRIAKLFVVLLPTCFPAKGNNLLR